MAKPKDTKSKDAKETKPIKETKSTPPKSVPIRDKRPGPGPAKYLLPTVIGYKGHSPHKYRNPRYTIRPKLEVKAKFLGPGPSHNLRNLTRYGKDNPPAWSLKAKVKPIKPYQTPAPGSHFNAKSKFREGQQPPAYSVIGRRPPLKKFPNPGPNIYKLPTTIGPKIPDIRANAAYSMRKNLKLKGIVRSPGPAAVSPPKLDTYKQRSPTYPILKKVKEIKDKFSPPGPNKYYIQYKRTGGFSIGRLTSNEPYITADDEMPCINE